MSVSGMVLDPKRFAVHDGPGVRTAFFLKGCPLRCVWCHNPESISPEAQLAYYAHKCIDCGECVSACPRQLHAASPHRFERAGCIACGNCEPACLGNALKLYGKRITVEDALELALEDRVFYEESGGGVTLSGGEPLFQPEFSLELLKQCKNAGLHTALDTCCFVSRASLEASLAVTDLYLVDFKHGDSAKHRALTGQGNETILDNLRFLSQKNARIEIRIPFVPGCNDSESELELCGDLLRTLNVETVKLLPYHSLARTKYASLGMADTMPRVDSPSPERLSRAVELLRARGVNAHSGQK